MNNLLDELIDYIRGGKIMEWANEIAGVFDTIEEVNVLIQKAMDRVCKELVEVCTGIEINMEENVSLNTDDNKCLKERKILINNYLVELNYHKIINKLLQRNRTLKGLTEDKVYKIIREMILEETTFDKVINQRELCMIHKKQVKYLVEIIKEIKSLRKELNIITKSLTK